MGLPKRYLVVKGRAGGRRPAVRKGRRRSRQGPAAQAAVLTVSTAQKSLHLVEAPASCPQWHEMTEAEKEAWDKVAP